MTSAPPPCGDLAPRGHAGEPGAAAAGRGDRVPADEAAAPEGFGSLFSPLFWLLILVSVVCICAGAVVGLAGAQLFPLRPAAPAHASTLGKPPAAR